MVATPELDKLHKVKDISQKIGEFLDWLRNETHYVIAEWKQTSSEDDEDGMLFPTSFSIEELLAEYFEIDLKKTEAERQAILDEFKQRNKKP